MKDHFISRLVIFVPFALLAAIPLYWSHGHFRINTICISAASAMYGLSAFMGPTFAKLTPLGTKNLRGAVTAIGFLLMTVGVILNVMH